ncbi:MAG TPA: FAD-dependent oxidoreductase [Candidatus Limnocylindrales bacterium]|nr:FAD-dependent oxidoreductase [Candidatus Limnocylindrales bacterium]
MDVGRSATRSRPSESARVVIIGGGVIGCAIARALVARGVDGVLLVEAKADVGEGASKANSAIVHTGFDARPGTAEARLLRAAAAHWTTLAEDLGVPFLSVGAIMLARTADDEERLRSVVRPLAEAHGVQTELLDPTALRAEAGYVTADARLGLAIPDESIVDPFWLTRAFAESAIASGATVLRDARVIGLQSRDDAVDVTLEDGATIRAEQVIDAAGLAAGEVATWLGDTSFSITPRKGQFLVSEETFEVDRIVLPVPGPMGKGMLVTPIVFGGILLGPTAVDIDDPTDRSTDPTEAERIIAACSTLVPAIADAVPVRSFAGLRPVPSTGEYIVGPSAVTDRLWLACGVRSTGISASPAIAEEVADGVLAARGWRDTRPSPGVVVPPPIVFADDPGELVCLCRGVSQAELDAAYDRPLAPTTIDGLKRRCGVTFGDCQGNLCTVDVATSLAARLGIDVTEVRKGAPGSWLFAGRAAGRPEPREARGEAADGDGGAADVIVIGGGYAGNAAAQALRDAGLGVTVVERRAGTTAVGLLQDSDGWDVEIRSPRGSELLRGRAVIVATGGYFQPREHGGIPGPRPSGVATADLVRAAVTAGLVPGRRAVVVTGSPDVTETPTALASLGVEVVETSIDRPDEIRGDERLEAVRFGDRWVDADLLVLADRLLPQTFLLRGLGLVDGRPGAVAPVDAHGRTPLAGLWAAGCCIDPDLRHDRCRAAGQRVGRAVAESLASTARMARP